MGLQVLGGKVIQLSHPMLQRKAKKVKPLSPQEAAKIEELRRFAEKHSTQTRQRRRRDQFLTSFREISKKYPGELRKFRRRVAKAIMKNFWDATVKKAA